MIETYIKVSAFKTPAQQRVASHMLHGLVGYRRAQEFIQQAYEYFHDNVGKDHALTRMAKRVLAADIGQDNVLSNDSLMAEVAHAIARNATLGKLFEKHDIENRK